ncbi:MAG: sugar transferase [Actinomycetota bacterium]|nr:sugar transferase [Actinomycetota bacterium]
MVALGEAHAHLVGHYRFTAFPRFGWLVVFTALLLVSFYAAGLPESARRFSGALVRSFAAALVAAGTVSVMALVVGEPLLPRFVVFLAVALLTPLVALLARLTSGVGGRRDAAERVLAVVGPAEAGALAADLRVARERPALLVASALAQDVRSSASRPRPLAELVTAHQATLVVLSREAISDEDVVVQAAELHRRGCKVRTLALFYDQWLGKLPLSELERSALLFDIHEIHNPAYARTKRAVDVLASLCALPLLALAAVLVVVADLAGNRGPLLYRQERVGKDGRIFTILKFRTMAPLSGEPTWTSVDDRRVGRVGRAMRKTHVDELPQVLNVLRRELSIVGPRPEQPRYVAELARRIDYYDLRHLVQPGITGWAQVNFDYGSSGFDALEKLQYEFYYLRHQSLLLDARIVGRTLRSIVGRTGR